MHEWDQSADLLAHSIIGYAVERLKTPKDPHWGAHPAEELLAVVGPTISAHGIGGHEALRVFRDVLLPSCRPMDDPLNLAYVPTAPTPAATMFDLVVSASSIFAGMWDSGAGAIAAENAAIRWLSDLAGYGDGAGGVFVSGGSAANLSALVTARHAFRQRHLEHSKTRLAIAVTDEVHASVRAAANVLDADLVLVPGDENGRMTTAAMTTAVVESGQPVFAVVLSAGTTNAGIVDDIFGIATWCRTNGVWSHVDGAYGLAALCAPSARHHFDGMALTDSFGVDPHKWLFAPYDCAALVYRDPSLAAQAHAQHGDYLDGIDRHEWNPSDYAYHLSRRARGLPLWFSLATYGTDAYTLAMETTLRVAHGFAREVDRRPAFRLLMEPTLSIVLFTVNGWTARDYQTWSDDRAKNGFALVVPTTHMGEVCLRICVVNPTTTSAHLTMILDDLERAAATRLFGND
jgi:L-2,4-diaminobutyrate decarboxylase